jgi:hypothetical protein
MSDTLTLYAVKNEKGQWFRRKGYGGYGETWINNFGAARIYAKIGHARAIISFFVNHYPDFPRPKLVALHIDRVEEIDEEARLQKEQEKQQKLEKKREENRLKMQLQHAEADLVRLQATVKDLKAKTGK